MSIAAPLQVSSAKPQSASLSVSSGLLQRRYPCANSTNLIDGFALYHSRHQHNHNSSLPPKCLVQCKPIDSNSSAEAWASVPTSAGIALPDDIRIVMEKRFQVSFGDVRIHSNDFAASQAVALGARAFTRGNDIHFAPGHYQPQSRVGLSLLAHELAHVVQQRNGKFNATTVSDHIAQSRNDLEKEAEQVERSVESSSTPLFIHGIADSDSLYCSPDILNEIRAQAFNNIETLADYFMGRTSDPLIAQLNALRGELRNLQQLSLRPEAVARFEAIYNEFRSLAPSWVPIPQISFAGPPAQYAGVIAIPIVVILLFIAFLIVLWWVLTNADPATRRARERAVEEAIEGLREAARRGPRPASPETISRPEPETAPSPQPRPAPGPQPRPPLGPDVLPPLPQIRFYPIYWSPLLPVPTVQRIFIRTPGRERDTRQATQAAMQRQWRAFRDPDFNPDQYHAHHVIPLFLGGEDDLRSNGISWPARIHLRGHRDLRIQPQMANPPAGLLPLPVDLYDHPPSTPYIYMGRKGDQGAPPSISPNYNSSGPPDLEDYEG